MLKSKEGLYIIPNLIDPTLSLRTSDVERAKSSLLTSMNPQEYTGFQSVPFVRNNATVALHGSYSSLKEDVLIDTKTRQITFATRLLNRGTLLAVTGATAYVDATDAVANAKTDITRKRATDRRDKIVQAFDVLDLSAITKFHYVTKDGALLALSTAYNIPTTDTSAYTSEVREALLKAMPARVHSKISNEVYVDKLLAKGLVNVDDFKRKISVRGDATVAAANAEQVTAVAALFAYFRDVEDADVTLIDYLDQYVADAAALHAAMAKYPSLASKPVNPYHITSSFAAVISALSGVTVTDQEGTWLMRMLRDAATGEYTLTSDGTDDYYDVGDYLMYPGASLSVNGDTVTVTFNGKVSTARLGVNTPSGERVAKVKEAFQIAIANAYRLIYDAEAPHYLRWARLGDVYTKPFLRM